MDGENEPDLALWHCLIGLLISGCPPAASVSPPADSPVRQTDLPIPLPYRRFHVHQNRYHSGYQRHGVVQGIRNRPCSHIPVIVAIPTPCLPLFSEFRPYRVE